MIFILLVILPSESQRILQYNITSEYILVFFYDYIGKKLYIKSETFSEQFSLPKRERPDVMIRLVYGSPTALSLWVAGF